MLWTAALLVVGEEVEGRRNRQEMLMLSLELRHQTKDSLAKIG
jgi:hypothetical protein